MKWYVVSSYLPNRRRFLFWPEMIVGHEGIEPATMEEKVANLNWDWFKFMPDYLHDLNAMHEAEKVLTLAQRVDYTNNLAKICGTEKEKVFATAAQRAEAFRRTIGKQEDS